MTSRVLLEKDFCHLQRTKSTGGFLDRGVTGGVTSIKPNMKYISKQNYCDDVTYANHICKSELLIRFKFLQVSLLVTPDFSLAARHALLVFLSVFLF